MTATVDTPEGVLLGVLRPGTPEWDAARAGLTITATEIAAVVGLSPWSNEYVLWHKKSGLPTPPFVPTPNTEWGLRHEPTVAAKFAECHPEYDVVETGTWRHAERDWQRATPDRILLADRGLPALLEIKTAEVTDGWGPDGTDEIPLHYRCQVMWQLDTLGLTHCHVAVLIGICDYREYLITYDQDEADLLRQHAADFLDRVRAGTRPDPDGSETTYATAKLQAVGHDDTETDIGPHLADRYRDGLEKARALDAERRQTSALILQRMGGARYATALGERVAIRTVKADGTTHALMPATHGKQDH